MSDTKQEPRKAIIPISNLVTVAMLLENLDAPIDHRQKLYAHLNVINTETGEVEHRKVLF